MIYTLFSIHDPAYKDSITAIGEPLSRRAALVTTMNGQVIDTLVRPPVRAAMNMMKLTIQTLLGPRTVSESLPMSAEAWASTFSNSGAWVYGEPDTRSFTFADTGGSSPLRVDSDLPVMLTHTEERDLLPDRAESGVRLLDPRAPVAMADVPTSKIFFKLFRSDHHGRSWVELYREAALVSRDGATVWIERVSAIRGAIQNDPLPTPVAISAAAPYTVRT